MTIPATRPPSITRPILIFPIAASLVDWERSYAVARAGRKGRCAVWLIFCEILLSSFENRWRAVLAIFLVVFHLCVCCQRDDPLGGWTGRLGLRLHSSRMFCACPNRVRAYRQMD